MKENDDFEPITEEEIDSLLRKHGYSPDMVGKYYALVAEHSMLKSKYKIAYDALYEIYCSGSPDDVFWQMTLDAILKIHEMESPHDPLTTNTADDERGVNDGSV